MRPIASPFNEIQAREFDIELARMGTIVGFPQARRGIGFAAFVPARRIVATALLPPFHGADDRKNRGIGFAYIDDRRRRYVLSEWPAHGGGIERFSTLAEPKCPAALSMPRGTALAGIVWMTPRHVVMSLAAEGKNNAPTLRTQWQRLLERGACR